MHAYVVVEDRCALFSLIKANGTWEIWTGNGNLACVIVMVT